MASPLLRYPDACENFSIESRTTELATMGHHAPGTGPWKYMTDAISDPGDSARRWPRTARLFTWGFVSQVVSSVTNFGLSVLAARSLGPAGLGAVFIGFSCYLISLGLQRALLTNPLVAESSAMDVPAQVVRTRQAFTTALIGAALVTVALLVAGLLLPDPFAHGAFLILPWLMPALIQDFWRTILFRDGRGRAAAINDCLWLLAMASVIPLVLESHDAWLVTGCWGLGAGTGAALGFLQTRLLPAAVGESLNWWKKRIWPVARWYATGSLTYVLGAQGLVLLLPFVIGTAGLGGLRAIYVIFAPLSLIGQALLLPGLPELSRRLALSRSEAMRFAMRLGAGAALLIGGYVVIAIGFRIELLRWIFGPTFARFQALVWPIALSQILIAPTTAFTALLLAEKRGRALLIGQIAGSVITLGLGISLAAATGPSGAAWGMATGSTLQGLTVTILALRPGRPGSGSFEVPLPQEQMPANYTGGEEV
jgi:O-antigen/teichoic acid export membrane protein